MFIPSLINPYEGFSARLRCCHEFVTSEEFVNEKFSRCYFLLIYVVDSRVNIIVDLYSYSRIFLARAMAKVRGVEGMNYRCWEVCRTSPWSHVVFGTADIYESVASVYINQIYIANENMVVYILDVFP